MLTKPEPEPPEDRVSIDIITDEAAEDDTLSVLSWNILCDRYCTQALYGYTPSAALEWAHRRERILQELKGRRPDIISLQECDEESFEDFFSPELAANEYKGVYYPKMRAERMAGKERKTVDGCAIFFNRQKYVAL
ncbi:MAG: endonuclease/exonuclease/phosphatase family protein [Terriglobus roseus]|nr:endonuclease/exonuclease/phosphatase family protein [Terriglobus roseus]